MDFLIADGVHIDIQYGSVLDRTYAYALLGAHVPEPVSDDDFIPHFLRRRWEQQWPRLVGERRVGFPWT